MSGLFPSVFISCLYCLLWSFSASPTLSFNLLRTRSFTNCFSLLSSFCGYLPLSFLVSFSSLNVLFASLLPPPTWSSPCSPSLPGCGVMYGPCQRWNQWDAGCFNLAWEPSGSRSSASWKSDGSGLSLLCCYSPPSLSLSVLPLSLPSCIDQHLAPIGRGSVEACLHRLKASEHK